VAKAKLFYFSFISCLKATAIDALATILNVYIAKACLYYFLFFSCLKATLIDTLVTENYS
jgi:hypothetical protein